jgi:hypothetical protein
MKRLCLRTQNTLLEPHQHQRKFFGSHVCRVIFKHLTHDAWFVLEISGPFLEISISNPVSQEFNIFKAQVNLRFTSAFNKWKFLSIYRSIFISFISQVFQISECSGMLQNTVYTVLN